MFLRKTFSVAGCWSTTPVRSLSYTCGEHFRPAPRFEEVIASRRLRLLCYGLASWPDRFFGREVSVFSDPLQTLRQLKDQGNVRCSHCSKKRRGRDMVLGNDTLMSFRHHCTLPTPFQHVVILVSAACRQLPLRYCPSPVALQPAPDMGSSESGRRDK